MQAAQSGVRRTPASIRKHLTVIVLAALLPMGLFAGLLLYLGWDFQQEQRNQEQLARVRTMAALVQSELDATIARMNLLATDPFLREGTLDQFHARLAEALRASPDWSNVLLVSRERQLLNAAAPYGTALPATLGQTYQAQAFETLRPSISNLFTARVRKTPTIAIAVPVLRDGGAQWVLVVGLDLGYISRMLSEIVPADGVAALFDRNLRFIARSRDPDTHVGLPPGDVLMKAMQSADEGSLRSTTREGESSFAAFVRLPDGFFIGVSTPSDLPDRALMRYLSILGVALMATLALGLGLSQWLAARINRSIARTVDTTRRLASGEAAEFPPSPVAELASVSDAVRRLFEREREARGQEQVAHRAKDEFLAMLGHELRNPLAPIVTALHLMRLRDDGLLRREREIIERQVRHMQRLVDDLLDISRIARGAIELRRAPVELADVVSEAIETAEPLIAGKGIATRVDVPAAGLRIDGDAARLCQIVSNLLINAAKFTPQGGHIALAASAGPGVVQLRVSDDGPGLPIAEQERIFEPFTQARQGVDRPDGGLGLGLAIARNLARLHGGDLTVDSEGAGRGSTFTLTLPLAGPGGPSDGAMVSEIAGVQAAGPKVLVVDDNVDAATALAELLGLWGYRTRVVHDGREVLTALPSFEPDIVLLDIGLPGLDGYEVAALIRAAPRWRRVRLIALTGYGQAEDEARSALAGFEGHFVKPVDLDRLAAALAQPAP